MPVPMELARSVRIAPRMAPFRMGPKVRCKNGFFYVTVFIDVSPYTYSVVIKDSIFYYVRYSSVILINLL